MIWEDLTQGGEEESKGKAQLKEKQPMTVSGGKSATRKPLVPVRSPHRNPA